MVPTITFTCHLRIESTTSTDRSQVKPIQVLQRTVLINGMRKTVNQHVDSRVLYFRNLASSISGYKKLQVTNSNGNIELKATATATESSSEVKKLIKVFSTDAGYFNGYHFNDNSSTNVKVRAWQTDDSGFLNPQYVKIGVEFFHRTSGGTETLIASALSSALTTSETNINLTSGTLNQYFDTDERLVVKVYGLFKAFES